LFIYTLNKMPRIPVIPTLTIGKLPSTYQSSIQLSKDSLLFQFASTIQYGPQIISLPVPPYRHAFLIDVQSHKILVSDWNGPDKDSHSNWQEYYTFLNLLYKKYNKPIEYYNVDKELLEDAMYTQMIFSGGGCAYYIYEWAKKYYPNYTV
jgi:hypothetical protein